jgi:hypothetical protein
MYSTVHALIQSQPAGNLLYLDPGTGSYLLQILIAAGMSVLLVLGVFRKKITGLFGRLFGRQAADTSEDDDSDDD